MENVLEKGGGCNDEIGCPPMHIHHMNREGERPTIAYLKSLPRANR